LLIQRRWWGGCAEAPGRPRSDERAAGHDPARGARPPSRRPGQLGAGRARAAHRHRAPHPHRTAQEQTERRLSLLSTHLKTMRAVSAAATPIYAALSWEQRRAADDLLAEHFRGMRMEMP
ncbi:MAG: Spy/CpxP family protein refolding chaperone, partial [Rubritepida sp.]|nr:Spy/CpxP family protein refolding chaperone [Rubritepida sp.]